MIKFKGAHPYPVSNRLGFGNFKMPYRYIRTKKDRHSYRVERYIECVVKKRPLSYRDFHHCRIYRNGILWNNKYWLLCTVY